jgi:hypothetical protein
MREKTRTLIAKANKDLGLPVLLCNPLTVLCLSQQLCIVSNLLKIILKLFYTNMDLNFRINPI